MSTISLSYVCVQHAVDRCVCRVERYVYVQQSKHGCVSISLLCLLYLCHMCVGSTSSTGACVVLRDICKCNKVNTCVCASLFYVYYTSVIRVCAARCRRLLYLCHMSVCSTMSTGAIYISHDSYTPTYESCLLYIYILVMSLTRLHMSHVSYTSIRESRRLYIYV